MRRLLWPVRTPVRRAALVAAAALWLLAWLLPSQPRWRGPTEGFDLIGFSPNGREVATYRQQFDPNKAFVRHVAGGTSGERTVSFDAGLEWDWDAPKNRRLFWEYANDPPAVRRRLDAVFGQAPVQRGGQCWVEGSSPDGRYWAYRVAGGRPAFGTDGDGDDVALVVREVATGRVVLTTPTGFRDAAFRRDGTLVTYHQHFFSMVPARVMRWDLAAGAVTSVRELPRLQYYLNLLTADGRYVIERFGTNAPRVFDADSGDAIKAPPDTLGVQPADDGAGPTNGPFLTFLLTTIRGDVDRFVFWNPTSREVRHYTVPLNYESQRSFSLSADGSLLVVRLSATKGPPLSAWGRLVTALEERGWHLGPAPVVALVDTAAGGEFGRLPCKSEAKAALSADGRQLAVLDDGTLSVYDLPLRRPWALALGGAALAAFGFAALDAVTRRVFRPAAQNSNVSPS